MMDLNSIGNSPIFYLYVCLILFQCFFFLYVCDFSPKLNLSHKKGVDKEKYDKYNALLPI